MSARPETASPTVDDIIRMLDAVTTRAECVKAIGSIPSTTMFSDEERAAISRAICRASGRAMKS